MCAHPLSRLLLSETSSVVLQLPEFLLVMQCFENDESPVTEHHLSSWTNNDPLLACVKRCVITGDWENIPEELALEIKPYVWRKNKWRLHVVSSRFDKKENFGKFWQIHPRYEFLRLPCDQTTSNFI